MTTDLAITIQEGVTGYIKKFVPANKAGKHEVRIELKPGGCSGHKYFLSPMDEKFDEDVVMEQDGVLFYMDGLLSEYFEGVEVNYVEGLNGTQIKVKNPNAKGGCGCGVSVKL